MELPVACTLSAGAHADRRARWARLADRALAGTQDTPDGICLRFRALAGVAAELDALAAAERECCAFAGWEVRGGGDEVTLDVSATGEGIGAVRELFAALRGSATANSGGGAAPPARPGSR